MITENLFLTFLLSIIKGETDDHFRNYSSNHNHNMSLPKRPTILYMESQPIDPRWVEHCRLLEEEAKKRAEDALNSSGPQLSFWKSRAREKQAAAVTGQWETSQIDFWKYRAEALEKEAIQKQTHPYKKDLDSPDPLA